MSIIQDTYKTWVLDVTFDIPTFIPYDITQETLITGLTVMADHCPGELVGVIHLDGQQAVDRWVAAHPNWYETYRHLENEKAHEDIDPAVGIPIVNVAEDIDIDCLCAECQKKVFAVEVETLTCWSCTPCDVCGLPGEHDRLAAPLSRDHVVDILSGNCSRIGAKETDP